MDKIIKKLRKLLEKAGLEEEKINSIVEEVGNDEEPEEEVIEHATVEASAEPEEPIDAPAPEETSDVPSDDPVVAEDEGEAVDEPAEPLPEEAPAEPLPDAETPIEPEVPQVEEPQPIVEPQQDPELLGKIEEQANTIEGLVARVQSLEEALRKGGILHSEEAGEIGIDESKTPANEPYDDPMTSILDKINRRR